MASYLLYDLDDCPKRTCNMVPWPLKNTKHASTLRPGHTFHVSVPLVSKGRVMMVPEDSRGGQELLETRTTLHEVLPEDKAQLWTPHPWKGFEVPGLGEAISAHGRGFEAR